MLFLPCFAIFVSWVIGLTLPYGEYVTFECTYVSILCSECYHLVYVQYEYNNTIV